MPSYPTDNLLSWTRQGFAEAGSDPQLLYRAIYEQLLVAQQLLANPDLRQQRRGLRVAYNANFKIAARLKDGWLSAHLFDGFLVPFLGAALTGESETLGRRRLLQDAANAYRRSKAADKQVAVLRVLVEVEERAKNADGADWARVKLADGLAAQNRYAEAIANLKAVKSPNMSGSKERISQLESLQKAQQQTGKVGS